SRILGIYYLNLRLDRVLSQHARRPEVAPDMPTGPGGKIPAISRHPAARARSSYYLSMTASTSRAESTRYSSPEYFTSVPPYLLYSTTSPTWTSTGTRAPLSSKRPGPTARTLPSWGFSFAVSGITSPDAVTCSASSGWTTIRSSSGLRTTLVAVVTICPPPPAMAYGLGAL